MKKHHNTSMAHSAKPHKKRPFRLLALLAMLCYGTLAWAQTEWTGSETNGTYTISSNKTIGNLTIPMGNTLTLNITGDNITFQFGTITLNNGNNTNAGANLNLNVTGNNVKLKFNLIKTNHADSKTKAGTVTLNNSGSNFIVNKRDKSSTNNLFYIAKNWSLEVIGTEANPVTFDGEWTMAENGIPTDNNQIANWKAYGVYYSYSGDITFKNVKVKNFVSNAVASQGEGGVFRYSGYNDMIMTTELTNVEIYQCYAGLANINFNPPNVNNSFGRIIGINNGILVANCNNLKIHNCFVHEPDNCEPAIYGMGSVIRSQGSVGGTFTIENSSFYDNTYMNRKTNQLTNQGGVINWRSGVNALGHEGKLVIKDCKFYNNKAKHGGAISTNGRMHLERVEIYNNEAVCGGGVFFWTYNGRQLSYDGEGFNAVFGEGVEIHDNTATEYGGGAYLTIDASNDVGFDAENQPISPSFQVQINTGCKIYHNKAPKGAGIAIMDACPYSHYYSDISKWSGEYQRTVTINGGKIYNNYAQDTEGDKMAGAGIYIEKYEYDENHPLSGFHTDYTNNPDSLAKNNSGLLNVNLLSGEIYGNSAVNDTIAGYGGGVYIGSKFETNTIKSTLNVNIGEEGKDLQIYNNQAYTDGGGVYVLYDRTNSRQNQGTVTVKGGTIGKTNLDTGNKALTGNGGGICVKGGTVSVNGGNVEYNTAGTSGGGVYVSVPNNESITTIQGAASISHNTANNGNGGGVCLDKGRINIYGSDISNNKATKGNGGGLYIQEGDILVWPNEMLTNPNNPAFSLCEATKTTVLNNTAGGNGGGLNTHVGRFDVRFAQIKNNTAGYNYSTVGTNGGNGGGLFCNGTEHDNGYTVRLLHCDLEENKAHGNSNDTVAPTGRGGGVYLKLGSIFAEHCDIIKNEADINGGGLDNHSGELRVFGTYINENKALTGRGGGLYTEEGNIVVGPCDTYGYIDSKASRIIKNTAHINGGGINNHHGDITIYGDRINENVAETGDGGGVYIKSGNIKMYGGQINNNKADKGKGGGVYGGSGTFNIMERKANPIMEIMEVEDIEATRFIVHFHHVDRGNAMKAGSTDKEFGIAYSKNPYPDINEDEEWTDANWSGVTKIKIKVADGTSDAITTSYPDSLYTYVRTEGCSRVIIRDSDSTSVDANTEYYVVAYGKYTFGGKNYFEASPALKIRTASGSKTSQGPRSVYPAVEENPFFQELTPLQQAILASTPEGDTTAARATNNGTHRDDLDPAPPVDIPEINYNTAVYGGGICIDLEGANLIFAGSREADPDTLGQINYNYASEAGGGIYIGRESADKYAKMQMMGKCEVNYNRVPAFKLGGGIYLDGRFYVGDQDTDAIGTHGLKVDKNFAIDKDQATFETELDAVIADTASPEVVAQYGKKTMNNVFLPRNEYNYYEHDDDASTATYNKVSVITLLSDISGYADQENKTDPYSHIGFSVVNGFCPVIATSNRFGGDYVVHNYERTPDSTETWLYHLMGMSITDNSGNDSTTVDALRGAIFEDSESYVAVHTRHDMAPFRNKYIYLWGCWTHPVVRDDPESLQPMVGATNADNPSADPKWLGHYVIRNHEQNTDTDTGDPLEWEIYSAEGLAWFTSYVNGLNAFDQKEGGDTIHWKWRAARNPKAKAKIMNDLDMSAFLWVPIGSVQKFYLTALASNDGSSLFVDSETQVMSEGDPDSTYSINAHYYSGTFDGQGHIIKGLQGLYLTGIRKFGLFGYLADGAVVMNTFVDEGLFVSDDDNITYHAGGIAGTMQGTAPSISNSEARMTLNATFSADNSAVGGLVGEVKAGSIHSCMAMPTFIGTTQNMGGVAGKLAAGTSIRNCFTNVLFPSTLDYKVGGIVGNNSGIVENVYVRYNYENNTPNLANDKFYWIAGLNTGSISYCFSPKDNTGSGKWVYTGPGSTAATKRRTYQPTNLVSDKYGFAHDDQKAEAFDNNSDGTDFIPMENGNPLSRMTYDETTHETYFNGLVGALNNWVAANSGHTPWMRTMASTINDDYPVLMFNDFNVVGTENGIYMKYDDNVNDMWKEPNPKSLVVAEKTGKNFQNLTAALNPKAAMYLYKTNGVTANNSTPVAINVTKNAAVPLHIHQNIGITQATVNDSLTARVGVTFDNSDGTIANGGAPYDWHMFSSALKAAPLGITYNSDNTNPATGGKVYEIYNHIDELSNTGITPEHYGSRQYMDPPVITWNTEEGTVGYFPTNTPYGKWGNSHWPSSGAFSGNSPEDYNSFDFYCLDEPSRHWINFKREGSADFMDHWHQDIDASGNHKNLKYMNEGTLRVGKGYMMGVSKTSMLMADGILNNGTFESEQAVTSTPYNFNMSGYSEELRGFNLVGNPYHSYLDFNKLLEANVGNIKGDAYYLFDADAGRYICYPADASPNPINAPQFIHPHQGFLVKTENDCMLTFNNAMRAAEPGTGSHFRSERLNYPLVNLFCHDAAGFYDVTTVEMNRPQLGGGVKLKETRNGNSLIYARLENEDYQTLFAPTGTSTVPVRFEPSQNGVYTLRWETMHGDFSHLHLIDNLTGSDIDLLNQTEYRFEGKVSDYVSRFKLVFEVTDIEEHEQESETNFAFQFGDELVVNGGGELSVFDVQGRHIMTRSLTGAQSSISLPRTAAGLYILRLAGDKQVKIQKLIIK